MPEDPRAFGSSTVTNGIRVRAGGVYNHGIMGHTDGEMYNFSYQISIDVVATENFNRAKLERRTWFIEKGDESDSVLD